MAEQTGGIETAVGSPLAPPERARWPWVAFAAFVITFVAEMVFHVLTGQGVATAISYVLAFTMFAVVGLVVRDARSPEPDRAPAPHRLVDHGGLHGGG